MGAVGHVAFSVLGRETSARSAPAQSSRLGALGLGSAGASLASIPNGIEASFGEPSAALALAEVSKSVAYSSVRSIFMR